MTGYSRPQSGVDTVYTFAWLNAIVARAAIRC
jgi:hypothetical protein